MKKINVLLINPPFKDFAAYDLYFKPYGLLNISSFFKNLGINPVFIDCIDKNNSEFEYDNSYYSGKTKNDGTSKFYKKEIKKPFILENIKRKYFLYGISPEFLKKYLDRFDNFDLIFVNITFTYHYNILYDIIPILKAHSKKSYIFLGGIYPTVFYEHALKIKNILKIDFVINGGFEKIIPCLLQLKENKFFPFKKKLLEAIEGYKKKILSKVNYFSFINFLPYIENYFSPDWDKYKKLNYGIIRTEKGCPYSCPYCSSRIIFSDYKEKPLDIIIKELTYFKDRNIKNIAFYDDALLVNKQRIKILLNMIYEKFGSYFNFYLPNAVHLKFVDKEILYYFKILNFKMIRFGFESALDYWIVKRGHKFGKLDLDNLFYLLDNSKIEKELFKFYILIGLPDQSEQEVKFSVNYLIEKGYKPYFALYSPIPNTKYYLKLLEDKKEYRLDEPLLQNPSIYTYYNTSFTEEKVKFWKMKIKRGKFI